MYNNEKKEIEINPFLTGKTISVKKKNNFKYIEKRTILINLHFKYIYTYIYMWTYLFFNN